MITHKHKIMKNTHAAMAGVAVHVQYRYKRIHFIQPCKELYLHTRCCMWQNNNNSTYSQQVGPCTIRELVLAQTEVIRLALPLKVYPCVSWLVVTSAWMAARMQAMRTSVHELVVVWSLRSLSHGACGITNHEVAEAFAGTARQA
jgi:hypothetical protein